MILDNREVDTPIIDILKIAQSTLSNGKLSLLQEKPEYIRVPCPVHKNGLEKHCSCSVYTGISDIPLGTWNCLTCGAKGSLTSFLAACFDSSEAYAKKWLLDNFGSDYITSMPDMEPIKLKQTITIENHDYSLERFEDFHPYMKKRHLTDEVIEKFDIKYDPETRSIVMPVRDKKGNIAFFTRRSTEGKRFIIDKGANKDILYGIDKINSDTIYIVESQFNALSLWSWGKQALATFGCGCPDSQIDVLNSLPVKHYIIAFDNDDAGKHGTLRLCNKLSKSKFVDVVLFKDQRDVNDLTKDEFESLKIVDRAEYLFTNRK